MSSEPQLVRDMVGLRNGENLLEILTKMPKGVSYPDLKLELYTDYNDESGEYDAPYACFVFDRMESPKEVETRLQIAARHSDHEEIRERGQLRYLIEKYGIPENE